MVDMSGLLQLLSIWVSHWVQQRGHNEQHPHRAVIIIQGEESIGHGIAKLDPDHPRALVMPFLSVTASLLDTLAAVEILNNINVISWGSRTDGFLGGDQILAKPEARVKLLMHLAPHCLKESYLTYFMSLMSFNTASVSGRLDSDWALHRL